MARGRKRKKNVARTKSAFRFDADLPTPEQLKHDDYERDFVTHAETDTKAMTYRKRDSTILEKWIREGGPGFDQGAQRVIADCQLYWMRMGNPKVTADYGERMPKGTNDNETTREEAADEIHYRKTLLGAGMNKYWDVFENVVRHNEPAGVAGSNFAKNAAQSIQSAKVITGFVASLLATKLGY